MRKKKKKHLYVYFQLKKMATLHTRRRAYGYKKEISRQKLKLFY